MSLKWKCGQIVLAVILGMVVSLASAHAQTSNGTIVGSVTDPAGAAVLGATVTVTNTDLGAFNGPRRRIPRGAIVSMAFYRELQCVHQSLRHAGIRGGWSCGEGVSRLHCERIFDYRNCKSISVCRSLYRRRITNAIRRAQQQSWANRTQESSYFGLNPIELAFTVAGVQEQANATT